METVLKQRFIIFLSITGLVFLLAVPAGATLWKSSVAGIVKIDNGGNNPFGLAEDDPVSATLIWDDTLVTGGSADEGINIDGKTGWDFTITLGSFSFSQADVTELGWTAFYFKFGAIDGIEFYLDPVTIGSFSDLLIEDFNGGQSLFVENSTSGAPVYLQADWDFDNAVNTVVPIPGTLTLFGAGLLVLFAGRRRTASEC